MVLIYGIAMLILSGSAVVSHGETVINVYASDKACYVDGSQKNSTVGSSVVAFSVGRKAEFSPTTTTIVPMDHVFYNDGGYFNMQTNYFTAPVSGVYAFHFGACGKPKKHLYLRLFIANTVKPVATTYNYNTAAHSHASVSVYQKMKREEKASLWLVGGFTVNSQNPPSTYFNGHLINPF